MVEPLLAVADLRAGYGSAVVLDDISLDLTAQGSLAVLSSDADAPHDLQGIGRQDCFADNVS